MSGRSRKFGVAPLDESRATLYQHGMSPASFAFETFRARIALLMFLATLWAFLSTSSASAEPLVLRTPIPAAGRMLRPLTVANIVVRTGLDTDLTLAKETYRVDVLDRLRALGYPAVGQDNLVFGRDKAGLAELALGGTITRIDCFPDDRRRDKCAISVDWEVMDQRSERIVYRMHASYGEGQTRKMKPLELSRRLVLGALDALLARQGFVTALERAEVGSTAGLDVGFADVARCSRAPAQMPRDTESALQATVVIRVGSATGSGFFVSDDGFVITAAHVALGSELMVRTHDGRETKATLVRVDRHADVALLRTGLLPTSCLVIRDDKPTTGSTGYAIGAPLGDALSFSVTRGVVSGMRRLDGVTVVQTDASINAGNSGGPMLDDEGRAFAVVSSKMVGRDVEGLAFGTYAPHALEALGVRLSDHTSESLRLAVLHEAVDAAIPEERDEDIVLSELRTAQSEDERKIQRNFRILLFSGIALSGAGLVTSLVGSVSDDSSGADIEGDSIGELVTDVGLLGVVAGGAVFGSAFIYRAIARRRHSQHSMSMELTPRSAALRVHF